MHKELREKIIRGEIDINNQRRFFSLLIKGLIYNLNRKISIRNEMVPHYVLNTGDSIMYLERKGENNAIEPFEVSNENFIYSVVPRCLVNPGSIDILTDQLTSPYTRGNFQLEYNDELVGFTAEFRRMPFKMKATLTYYVDSFTDGMELVQQVVSQLCFINNYKISYLGQNIMCTYKVPDAFDLDHTIDFALNEQTNTQKKLSIELEIESNIPIYYNRTVIESDGFITISKHEIDVVGTDSIKEGVTKNGDTIIYEPEREIDITSSGRYYVKGITWANVMVDGVDCIEYKTVEEWMSDPTYVASAGVICIVSDYKKDGDTYIPGIKVSDGKTPVVDLPYITDYMDKMLVYHINDDSAHITAAERLKWDHKLDCEDYVDPNDENFILFRSI